jgi:replicative DNA helicase
MIDSVYQINIERSLLNSIIFKNDALDEILEILDKNDFYLPAHSEIFEKMCSLANDKKNIDENFLLKDNPNFQNALLDVLAQSPISNYISYAKELKDNALKRHLSSLAPQINELCDNDNKSGDEVFNEIQEKLYNISINNVSNELQDMGQMLDNTINHMHKMSEIKDGLIGITTGFKSLDKKTTGFSGGDLIILAARPSMGKTALALNMALENIKQNNGVIFFSLEMGNIQLTLRLLSAYTALPLGKIRLGDLNESEWQRINDAKEILKQKMFFVDDLGSLNINQLRARVKKLIQNKDNNIKMIMIDYLGLMSSIEKTDRQNAISEISRGLKTLARELNMPIVALAQLNRMLESRDDKRPMLSDIRESGSIEQDADIVMFVYRDDVYKKHEEANKEKEAQKKGEAYKSAYIEKDIESADIIIAKQRNGPTGTVKMNFHKKLTKFEDKEMFANPVPLEVRMPIDIQKHISTPDF